MIESHRWRDFFVYRYVDDHSEEGAYWPSFFIFRLTEKALHHLAMDSGESTVEARRRASLIKHEL